MTEFAPGWYPDPDDPDARRYWDGAHWSAPLPSEQDRAPAAAVEWTTPAAPAPPPPRPVREFAGVVAPSGSSALVCPHCGVQGKVRSRSVKQKKGISGGKATGAVLTAGFSILATGLSRKERVTEMRCGNCGTKWHV